MGADILLVPGGLGLFLLGMVVLTEGLRLLAGGALRRLLARFTKTPLRAVVAGSLATAIVQSSSATTVTAVGFVGAGLLTFPQGLGIVFGANIGTTITGWIVAILGFKLQLGLIVLPLVLLGVLLRLFGRGRLRAVGWALAGFGLLFVGIDAMQQGMAPFEGVVTPADFPEDTLIGRLQLLGIGVLITLVTQSSSAGVATALVALGAGTISFAQAAAMVIGMDVGTTFTAFLATLGGATAARQTGYAHVIYNVLTAIMAFFLLAPFTAFVAPWLLAGESGDAQIALVAFHSTFNAIGVLLVLPFTRPFAAMILRLVPERGPPLLRRLDRRLLGDSRVAVDGATATIGDITEELSDLLQAQLGFEITDEQLEARLVRVGEALRATRDFVEEIRSDPSDRETHRRHVAVMHALDHLMRLAHRCGQTTRITGLAGAPRLRRLAGVLQGAVARYGPTLKGQQAPGQQEAAAYFDRLRQLYGDQRHLYRQRTVAAAARQQIATATALARLDSVRWLHRVAYHLWRILYHLDCASQEDPAAT